MTFVGWFAIGTGVAMLALWGTLLAARQVPEIPEGRRDIWFHLAAELSIACLLVAAGAALVVSGGAAAALWTAVALGGLLYSTVNSAGYYADLGQWPAVAMFAVLTVGTAVAAVVLWNGVVP